MGVPGWQDFCLRVKPMLHADSPVRQCVHSSTNDFASRWDTVQTAFSLIPSIRSPPILVCLTLRRNRGLVAVCDR